MGLLNAFGNTWKAIQGVERQNIPKVLENVLLNSNAVKNPDHWLGLNSLSESFATGGPKNLKHWFAGRNYSKNVSFLDSKTNMSGRNYGRAAARIGTVAGMGAIASAPYMIGVNAVSNWWNGR